MSSMISPNARSSKVYLSIRPGGTLARSRSLQFCPNANLGKGTIIAILSMLNLLKNIEALPKIPSQFSNINFNHIKYSILELCFA